MYLVGRRHDWPRARGELACAEVSRDGRRPVVQPVDLGRVARDAAARVLVGEEPVGDHDRGAATRLLRRLEDQVRRASRGEREVVCDSTANDGPQTTDREEEASHTFHTQHTASNRRVGRRGERVEGASRRQTSCVAARRAPRPRRGASTCGHRDHKGVRPCTARANTGPVRQSQQPR